MNIIVDIHEADSGILGDIAATGIPTTSQSLEYGDVLIQHNLSITGIEIKRNQDFGHSLHSGRLHNQLFNLTRKTDFPVLIIEDWKPYFADDSTEETLAAAMSRHRATVRSLNRKICVVETENQADTVDEIQRIAEAMEDGTLDVLKRRIMLVDDADPQVQVLASLPNVSIARARELLDMFGSSLNAMNHAKEWDKEIKGITESRRQEIIEILEGENHEV